MAVGSIFQKLWKKADKEAAGELSAALKTSEGAKRPEEAKAEQEALKEKRKQEAIARYHEKRTLTVEKFFDIAGLSLPDSFSDISQTVIDQFTADPRKVTESSVFLCWERPLSRWRPSETLEQAMERKCLCIITDTPCEYSHVMCLPWEGQKENPVREAYVKAGAYIRGLHKAKVITITGSVGKTSTKEMVESVLRAHYRQPLVSKGNNNSLFSVTRNIQNLKPFHNVYLQEVGALVPETVSLSARQLSADIALYTNIGHSHIENYGTLEELARDKLSLSDSGNPEGTAVINYDDKTLMQHSYRQKVVTYSLRSEGADYHAADIVKKGIGYDFAIVCHNAEGETDRLPAHVNVLGEHNILNAVAAFAVGKELHLSDEEILRGIEAYRPSGIRQNLIEIGPYHVFADCYNSSLVAVENTLSAMDEMELPAEGGRKIAVLGDVLELGEISREVHREIGRTAASHQLDLLLGFGSDMEFACEEAAAAGLEARFFRDRGQLEAAIRTEVTPKDIVLFKASHGINIGASMERIYGTDVNESTQIGHKMFYLKTEGDFEFYIFDTSASLKSYLGEKEEVVVPAYIEASPFSLTETPEPIRLPVEKIGKTAFRDKKHVKKVTLPETVVRIRSGAFQGSGLTEFTAPDSLLSVGEEAFADCPDLTEVILPENIYLIEENLLKNSPKAVLKQKSSGRD